MRKSLSNLGREFKIIVEGRSVELINIYGS